MSVFKRFNLYNEDGSIEHKDLPCLTLYVELDLLLYWIEHEDEYEDKTNEIYRINEAQ